MRGNGLLRIKPFIVYAKSQLLYKLYINQCCYIWFKIHFLVRSREHAKNTHKVKSDKWIITTTFHSLTADGLEKLIFAFISFALCISLHIVFCFFCIRSYFCLFIKICHVVKAKNVDIFGQHACIHWHMNYKLDLSYISTVLFFCIVCNFYVLGIFK